MSQKANNRLSPDVRGHHRVMVRCIGGDGNQTGRGTFDHPRHHCISHSIGVPPRYIVSLTRFQSHNQFSPQLAPIKLWPKKIAALAAMLLVVTASLAQTRSVLFLGNSYTYFNNLPATIEAVAQSKGDTLLWEANTPGGYTFSLHCDDQTSRAMIAQQPWDVVVLQEQSQLPSFPPPQVATEVYPYATRLDSLVRVNDTCTETMFFMTWGRKNGDAANCPINPPVCTYEGMQQRLRESYMEMGQMNLAAVAPVGEAWKRVRQFFPGIELYNADESHPSVSGTYLAACVFYASLWHQSAVGALFPPEISSDDALRIQTVASRVVLDSVLLWQEPGTLPRAAFYIVQNGNEVQFVNQSFNAGDYFWDFGDGGTSTLTNPTHRYIQNGSYEATLHVSNGCMDEVATDTITIITVGTPSEGYRYQSLLHILPNPAIDKVEVECEEPLATAAPTLTLTLNDLTGRLIWQKQAPSPREVIYLGGFAPGRYLVAYRDATGIILAAEWLVKAM